MPSRDIGVSQSDAEITLEANPTSVEAENFAGYRSAGVNRLSLGVQALDDQSLKSLGRQHTAEEALAALALAKRHFARVSFDLIYAREGQTAIEWEAELTPRAGSCRRPPLALSAHHRGGHAVRRAACQPARCASLTASRPASFIA